MKYSWLLLLFLLLVACHHPSSSYTENNTKSAVELELEQATANKDFRLYATSGRRLTVPGVTENDKASLISQCGRKFMSGTGDVLKSEQARTERKFKIVYMTTYNLKMTMVCRSNK